MNEIKYILSAEVDGVEVYCGTFDDTTILQESLYKAERAVEKELESEEA